MEMCSFAPKINKKKKRNAGQKSAVPSDANQVYYDQNGAQLDDQYPEAEEEDEEQPRHIDAFVADQQRFLEQKRAKEE